MSNEGFRDRIWRSVEGSIDPFHDTDREVLPEDAWRFILYFANQAKGAFVLLLITGGLAGAVDAAMYWSVGWLIDLLDRSSPTTLVRRPLARADRSAVSHSCCPRGHHDRLGGRRAAGGGAGLLFDGAVAGVPACHPAALRLLPERFRRPHRHQDHAGRRGRRRLHRQRAADHVVVPDLRDPVDHHPGVARPADGCRRGAVVRRLCRHRLVPAAGDAARRP